MPDGIRAVEKVPPGYVRIDYVMETRPSSLRVRCEDYAIWLPKRAIVERRVPGRLFEDLGSLYAPKWVVENAKKHETAAIFDTGIPDARL